jgi:CRP/FNR family transcriptional activator FtrB
MGNVASLGPESSWKQLASTPPFSGIQDPHYLDLLKANAVVRRLPKWTLLFQEGERPSHLYFIGSGTIQLSAAHGRRLIALEVYDRPAAFPFDAIICAGLALESARTLSVAMAIELPADMIRKVFQEDGCFARAVAQTLAEQKRRIVSFRKLETLLTSSERLAHWALQDADQKTGVINIAANKTVLAAQLGMAPENLSRSLSTLTQHGLSTNGRQLYITDREKLQSFANSKSLMDL